jgi:hypothetical protein
MARGLKGWGQTWIAEMSGSGVPIRAVGPSGPAVRRIARTCASLDGLTGHFRLRPCIGPTSPDCLISSADTLKGFIAAARELGLPVTDEKAFLKEQQRRVLEWAGSGGSVGASYGD